MKPIFFLPLLVLASCVSRQAPQVLLKPLPSVKVDHAEALRFGETVRMYYIGRYVDPNHPDLMHEEHPLYRVEAYSRWNLKPGGSTLATGGLAGGTKDAAFFPPPTNDVVIAELNRQKDATERVIQEAARLARSYDQLQTALNEMGSVVKSHLSITSRLSTAEQRVSTFEKELQRLTRPPEGATNEIPSFPTMETELPPK